MATRKASDSNLTGKKYSDASAGTSKVKDIPDLPTLSSATNVGTGRAYNNGAATITMTAAATGGVPDSYTVTSSPGSFTSTGSSPLTVTGLQSAVSYTFTAYATTGVGNSPTTPASSSITATTVPNAPTIGSASSSTAAQATVAFTAPAATGGSAITGYRVKVASGPSSSATATGASSPITITGLSGGSYTFTVAAENANGYSAESSATSPATTVADPAYELVLTANNSQSWTVPSGKNSVAVYVVGGGATGGSGGSAAAFKDYSVSAGQSYYVTVGGASGTSSFGSLATANGGGGNASSNVAGALTKTGGSAYGGQAQTPIALGTADLPSMAFGGAGGSPGPANNQPGNNPEFYFGGPASGGPGGQAYGGAGGFGNMCGPGPVYSGAAGGSAGSGPGGGGGAGGQDPGRGPAPAGAGHPGRVLVYVR